MTMKRWIAAFLCAVMVLGMVPAQALAVEVGHDHVHGDHQHVQTITKSYVNPIFNDISAVPAAPVAAGEEEVEYQTSIADAAAVVLEQFKARQNTITVGLLTDTLTETELQDVMNAALAHNGNGDEGDYLYWQYGGWHGTRAGYGQGGKYYLTLTYEVTYYTDAAQEAAVTAAVDALLAELDLDGQDDYHKVKGVYDWITHHVVYDYEHLYDTFYKLKHTAYAALIDRTSVCQGYAVLLYRLLLELGVDCRVIGGTSNGGGHAWNIIKLGDLYYNADSTWDAGMSVYSYFLKGGGFGDHVRDAEYLTDSFNAAYPMSGESYAFGEATVEASGVYNNITWELDSHGVLTFTGEGDLNPSSWDEPFWRDYYNRIEKVVIGSGITSIGPYAFEGCWKILQVTLSETVTRIWNPAVYYRYVVHEDNPVYASDEGGFLFDKSMTELMNAPVSFTGQYVVPDSVEVIGGSAFSNCAGLTDIVWPANLTTIEGSAFYGCDGLTKISIPATVTYMGNNAFSCCEGLTEIELPDSLTVINDGTFDYCSGLTSVRIPGSVRRVFGFAHCENLEEVFFEHGVEIVDGFQYNTKLTRIYFPESIKSIRGFEGCTALTSIALPNSLEKIENNTFAGCIGLTSLVLPINVTHIGKKAFEACTALAEVRFLGDQPQIEEDAFIGVTAICYYPANCGVWEVEDQPQYGGTLNWIPYEKELEIIHSGWCGEFLYWELDNLGTLTISGSGDMYDRSDTWSVPWTDYSKQIYKVVVQEGVTSLGDSAFRELEKMIEIELPESLTDLGSGTFTLCIQLKEIDIPAGVTHIGGYVFNRCDSLTSVTVPSGATKIDEGAFMGCYGLTSVIIPASVASIGMDVFEGCNSLQSVWFLGDAPSIHPNAFEDASCTAYYPANRKGWDKVVQSPYHGNVTWTPMETAQNSGTCGENLTWELNEYGVLTISGTGVMEDYSEGTAPWYEHRLGIYTVMIDDGVTGVGAYAFAGCVALDTVIFARELESLGENCLSDVFATAYYPSYEDLWTEELWNACGGNVTWRQCDWAGIAGTNVKWILDYGVLSFVGTGAIADYTQEAPPEWNVSDFYAIIVGADITYIGAYAFQGSVATSINFVGDAPEFSPMALAGLNAMANYPAEARGWTEDVCQDYGGTITWTSRCSGEHIMSETVVAPTCTEQGYTKYECGNCDYQYVENVTEALGHDMGEWHRTARPYCETAGEERRNCTRCDHYETREVPAMGHSYEANVFEPGCETQGYTYYWCTNCGHSYEDAYTEPLGHEMSDWYVREDATCERDGTEQRSCIRCGNYETRVAPALGHDYQDVVTAAFCEIGGYTTHTCSRCYYSYVDTYTEPLGHDFGQWEVLVKASCSYTGMEQRTCSRCAHSETREIPVTDHEWTAANCETARCCAVCGAKDGEPLGHDMSDWYTVVKPTCTESGEERRDCTRCGQSEYRGVGATGHNYTSVITESTCTEGGYTTHTCGECHHTYVDANVDALGHDWQDPTCETASVCARCGEKTGEPLGHSYESVVTEATCVAGGYTTYTCTLCDHSYVGSESEIDPENHVGEMGSICECGVYLPYCGTADGVNWVLDQNGKLTISGEGLLEWTDYPWDAYQDQITEVVIETGANVGRSAFATFPELTKVTLAEGITIIHLWTYAETPKLTEINLPSTLKIIDDFSFSRSGLGQISLPEGLERIGSMSFYMTQLSEIVIPSTVTEIGNYALGNCQNLQTIIFLGDAPITIGATAFEDTTATVYYPAGNDTWTEEIMKQYCGTITWVASCFGEHKYEEVVTPATCTEQGYTKHVCVNCGDEYIDSYVDALGHNYESVATEATCVAGGYTTHTCANCGHNYIDSETEPLGHDWQDADCENPQICARCGETQGEALGHNYESVVTEATCVAGGYTTHTCMVCGHSYIDGETEIDPENHVGQEGTECECGVFLGDITVPDGWYAENGLWYFYQNGQKVTGWLQVGGIWYFMDAAGVMQTGWIQDGRKWYYMDAYGAMQSGWLCQNGVWYYLKNHMVTGWQQIDGVWYYFNGSGAMQSGWLQIGGIWYYLNSEMKTGWQQIGGAWYYFNANGAMQSGWLLDGGVWYYLNNHMQTGWQLIDGCWYLFNGAGAMQSGWQSVGGKWYYLNNHMITGWLQLGNTWYYLDATGAMVTGSYVIGGVTYYFDANGAWIP